MRNLRHLLSRFGIAPSQERLRRGPRTSPTRSRRALSSESLEKRELLAGDILFAHNYLNPADVDDNMQITASDALRVINALSSSSGAIEVTEAGQIDGYMDVNGDGFVSASDALSVINAVQRGEAASGGVSLFLNLRDVNDEALTTDTDRTATIDAGEVFFLEVSYSDDRTFGGDIGAFQVVTDILVDQADVLTPIVTDTDDINIENTLQDASSGTVTFSLDDGTDAEVTVEFDELASDLDGVIRDAVVELGGYDPDTVTVSALQGEPLGRFPGQATPTPSGEANFQFRIRYTDLALANQDLPNLQVSFDLDVAVRSEVISTSPLDEDGNVRGSAVGLNIDTRSRTAPSASPFGREIYNSLTLGTYIADDGNGGSVFDNFLAVGPLSGGGIAEAVPDFEEPFDTFSIPVFISSAVEDLNFSLAFAGGGDDFLLYGEDGDDAILTENQIEFDPVLSVVSLNVVDPNNTTPGVFAIDPASISVDENAGTTSFTVNRTGGSTGEVMVNFATADGTAAAGSDFTAQSDTLTFADGVTSQTITVAILDDVTPEADETFTVSLSAPTGGATLGAIASSTVTILDNDDVVAPVPGTLSISPATISVNEDGGTATFTVTRTDGSDGTVTVDFATADGTATAGSDYTVQTGTLSFADGVTSQTITVPILDDAIDEDDETFTVAISNATGGASLGTTTTATATILDDDNAVPVPGELSIAPATISVDEDAGTATFTVNRTGGSDGPVSVNFATADGTATAGSDFVGQTGTLNFADGVTSQTITVVITDDDVDENDETFSVAISGAGGGATLGTATTSTATIIDNDVPVVIVPGELSIAPATTSVNEGSGTVTFTVNRTGGSDGAVTVDFTTANGTATGGSDFVAQTDTLSFADGVISQTITVAIIDDGIDEPNEDFTVTLSGPTGGATLGAVTSSTATIIDNDAAVPVNQPPSSGPISVSATEDIAATFTSATLLAGASAGETDQTVSITSVPASSTEGGTLALNGAGGVDYTPAADFNGSDSFVVTITDTGSPAESATFTVTVNVASVNDAPVANNDSAFAAQGIPTTINVLGNDNAGPANEDQTLNVVSASSGQGNVTINADGTLTFTSNGDFLGNATINYTIEDSDGAQDSAVATVTVADFVPVTLSGSIFIDNADPIRDGIQNGGDVAIGGIQVRLVSSTGTTIASVITALDGSYSFTDVGPGDYTLVYDVPDTIRTIGSTSFPIVVDANSTTPPSVPNLSVAGTQNTGLETLTILSSSYLRRNGGIADMSNGGREGGSIVFDEDGNQEIFIAGEGFEDVVFGEIVMSTFGDSAVMVIVRDGASAPEVAIIDSEFIIGSSGGQSIQFFGGLEDFDFTAIDGAVESVELAQFQAAVDRALSEL